MTAGQCLLVQSQDRHSESRVLRQSAGPSCFQALVSSFEEIGLETLLGSLILPYVSSGCMYLGGGGRSHQGGISFDDVGDGTKVVPEAENCSVATKHHGPKPKPRRKMRQKPNFLNVEVR
jgi:hypothetical protein